MMVKLEGLTEREIKENKLVKMTNDFFESRKIPYELTFQVFLDEYEEKYLYGSNKLGITDTRASYFAQVLPGIWENSFYVFFKDGAAYVNWLKNRIVTVSPTILDKIGALAEAYEEAGFGEFTVKKQYEE